MIKMLLTTIMLTSVSLIGISQTFNKSKLDKYFEVLEAKNKFMGSVALSQNGKIIYTKQIGFADLENKIKPNINTKYRIGSISKSFTTVLIFKAIEENKLKLSDKLSQYYPSITNSQKITISNLLNHRSGIHNFTSSEDYLRWNTQKKSEKELVGFIVKGGSDFELDTKAEYSNSNFVLLSFILQKVYKQNYAQLLSDKITKPIDLRNTYFGKPVSIKDNECFSYSFKGTWVKEAETDMSIPMGAGAVVSTPSDLAQFAYSLFNGKLVSSEDLEQMKTVKDNYGMGLFKVPFYEKVGYGHTGGIDGFTSDYVYIPSDNICAALTSNATNFDNNTIMIALLTAIYNKPYAIPTFKVFAVTAIDLDKYLGTYVSPQIPLKIVITKDQKTLIAQATGQPSFTLDATEKDKFKFDQAGIVLKFDPTQKAMLLNQAGKTYNFTKE